LKDVISIGHSPDADDAFMFYGFAEGRVEIPGYSIHHVLNDIQTLNDMSLAGDLDITAISAAHYPRIADKYRIMSCGVSMGRKYGPIVVARQPMATDDLSDKVVGCPGEQTTSWLLYRILIGKFKSVKFEHFDALDGALARGEVDAAIMLHEKQVTFADDGLHLVADLGREWFERTALPIPLGLDVVKRSLGTRLTQILTDAFYASIKYALDNEDAALDYAMTYGRGLKREQARKFIKMYVNRDTLDMGEQGRAALGKLFAMSRDAGVLNEAPPLDIIQARD